MLSGDNAIDLWEQVREKLRLEAGEIVFNNWLGLLSLSSFSDGKIVLAVHSKFHKDWIEPRYGNRIRTLWQGFSKDVVSVSLIVDERLTGKASRKVEDSASSVLNLSSPLDSRYTFDKFIVGPSNNFVAAAAERISDSTDVTFNPLVIYGGVGLGKTHLLNSIGYEMSKNKKVMFISAERFMYQFVKSIKSNDMVKFKEYFRNTDVLLIDDIQFMNGKEAMQEEFFHTFNALLDKDSQIIVSADRPPNKLSRIQERIKSRFSGGLVVDIQKPEYDLRKKIINHKINELTSLYADKVNVTDEIQDFISNKITNNVRELVGAINRIISFSRIYNKLPSLSETKIILKDLLNLTENNVTIDSIQTIVCKFFKISKNEMLSSRRSRYLVRPRQTAIYLTKILTTKSLPEIGREFSNRDHTTIIHSVKTIEKLKEINPDMNDNINKLKNIILYNKEG